MTPIGLTDDAGDQTAIEELVARLRRLNENGPIAAEGRGSGRYGLALERELGIPRNSSKAPDFRGIEIKTKASAKLQTLFSRTPSNFGPYPSAKSFLDAHGYTKNGTHQLYTSINATGDSLGFQIAAKTDSVAVIRGGEEVMEFEHGRLQSALESKHSESAFVSVTLCENGSACFFDMLVHARNPSYERFRQLVDEGGIFLDLTLKSRDGRVRDHGYLWRIRGTDTQRIFAETTSYQLR